MSCPQPDKQCAFCCAIGPVRTGFHHHSGATASVNVSPPPQLEEICNGVTTGGSVAVEAGTRFQASLFGLGGESWTQVTAEAWTEATRQVCNTMQSSYGLSEGTVFSEELTVALEAPANSQAAYEIVWSTVSLSGLIELSYGNEVLFVPFSIPNRLQVEVRPPESEACE